MSIPRACRHICWTATAPGVSQAGLLSVDIIFIGYDQKEVFILSSSAGDGFSRLFRNISDGGTVAARVVRLDGSFVPLWNSIHWKI